MNTRLGIVGGIALVGLAAAGLEAKSEMMDPGFMMSHTEFAMLDKSVGGSLPPVVDGAHASLAGGVIAALADGALVIDEDSGKLIRTDATGTAISTLDIGADAGQLVVDRTGTRAYVADRMGDRIAIVAVGQSLNLEDSFPTRAEPYGLALLPDGDTLLVTTVADRQLTAYDIATGNERWSEPLGPEPRGVAVSRDGGEAMVAYLAMGAVERIALDDDRHERGYVSLHQGMPATAALGFGFGFGSTTPDGASANSASSQGRSFARNAFAVMYIGNEVAVTAHQISTPHQAEGSENTGSYGGGFTPPITHRVTFVGPETDASPVAAALVGLHQPRALGYDAGEDILYIAGFGTDDVLVLANASQTGVRREFRHMLNSNGVQCGPTGLAVAGDRAIWAYCSLSRTVVRIDATNATMTHSPAELAPSRWSEQQARGRALFRQGQNFRLSANGALACANCHPEGRTDGLSWRIEQKTLQTPVLAGRVAGTHPFKWDGGDATIDVSLINTVRRLGGFINQQEAADLESFITALPAPRAPSRDKKAVKRGKKLFNSDAVGCASCHTGKQKTDGNSYDLTDQFPKVDTPSLLGLASSAPYYHDGSAATLRALLLDNGSVHGMGDVEDLSDDDIDDLIAYLESL
jgi:mono/diheme cytochrome c family protein